MPARPAPITAIVVIASPSFFLAAHDTLANQCQLSTSAVHNSRIGYVFTPNHTTKIIRDRQRTQRLARPTTTSTNPVYGHVNEKI
jgi:hypothetical protein